MASSSSSVTSLIRKAKRDINEEAKQKPEFGSGGSGEFYGGDQIHVVKKKEPSVVPFSGTGHRLTYKDMALEAVAASKDRRGATRQEIKQYIADKYEKKNGPLVTKALKTLSEDGVLEPGSTSSRFRVNVALKALKGAAMFVGKLKKKRKAKKADLRNKRAKFLERFGGKKKEKKAT